MILYHNDDDDDDDDVMSLSDLFSTLNKKEGKYIEL